MSQDDGSQKKSGLFETNSGNRVDKAPLFSLDKVTFNIARVRVRADYNSAKRVAEN